MGQETGTVKQLSEYANRRAAEAVVDAALVCRVERGEKPIPPEARKALIEALQRNPLLTLRLFSFESPLQ